MSAIEQAIKEAVKKGSYKAGWRLHSLQRIGEGTMTAGFETIRNQQRQVFAVSDLFLDPAFWSALGKARGWLEASDPCGRGPKCHECHEYMKYWHRFIDHLAEGKDVETFFQAL